MVRTRFAPSPTGYLHIGGVRTALFNWLFARQHGGQFILRIDDTDEQRNVRDALQPILDGLRWLGIDWDEGPEVDGPYAPYYQSLRAPRYEAAVQQLLACGAAYWDYALPEELQRERETAQAEQRSFRYSRQWSAESPDDRQRFEAQGRTAVVRLKMPQSGKIIICDQIRGDVEFDWGQEQDHVVQRADGTCLYHLATVVDDYDFRITHVIRAEEHLSNTPRQVFIAQSLGYPVPEFAHLPFVAEPGSKTKISKRKLQKYLKHHDFSQLMQHASTIMQRLGDVPDAESFNPILVGFYQRIGFLPQSLLNYFLLLGWSLDEKTEFFSRDEMIAQFSLPRVNHAPASFDPAKLMSFQDHYMRGLPMKQKVPLVLPYLQEAGWVNSPPPCDVGPYLLQVLTAIGDRLRVSGDILSFDEFFVDEEKLTVDAQAVSKCLATSDSRAILHEYQVALAELAPFDLTTLEQHMKDFLATRSLKMGQLVHGLRVAVTGKSIGCGVFETLAILGRERCVRRIGRLLEQIS